MINHSTPEKRVIGILCVLLRCTGRPRRRLKSALNIPVSAVRFETIGSTHICEIDEIFAVQSIWVEATIS